VDQTSYEYSCRFCGFVQEEPSRRLRIGTFAVFAAGFLFLTGAVGLVIAVHNDHGRAAATALVLVGSAVVLYCFGWNCFGWTGITCRTAKACIGPAGSGLEDLNRSTNILELDLSSYFPIDATLKHLQGLTSLQTLNLSQSDLSDDGPLHLAGLIGLQSLQLADTLVTYAGLKHLKGLRNLQRPDLAADKENARLWA